MAHTPESFAEIRARGTAALETQSLVVGRVCWTAMTPRPTAGAGILL